MTVHQRPRPPGAVCGPLSSDTVDKRESQRLEELDAEARYHRQRLDLYRARLYGGRAVSQARLEEFQRASDEAAARLRHARNP
jgi:hypothetical protein